MSQPYLNELCSNDSDIEEGYGSEVDTENDSEYEMEEYFEVENPRSQTNAPEEVIVDDANAEEEERKQNEQNERNERIITNFLANLNRRFQGQRNGIREDNRDDSDDDNDEDSEDDEILADDRENSIIPEQFQDNPIQGEEAKIQEEDQVVQGIPPPPPATEDRLHLLAIHRRTNENINVILRELRARYNNGNNNT